METIVAVASPPGGGLRGIVRLSGPRAIELARAVGGARLESVETLLRRPIRVPAIVLVQKGPRSYTREDVVEFHLPGSPPLLRALVDDLCSLGARPARPGEFTLRAFLNGRLDLAQAEAVEDLISASGEAEARAAAEQLHGSFSHPIRAIEDDLLSLAADVEAAIDFVDQDIEIVSGEAVVRRSTAIEERLAALLATTATRRVEHARPVVALFGKPNVGKSSLFNRLGGDAIVSDRAGTTRDRLTAELGEFTLVDTPGRRDAGEESADLVLYVVEAGDADRSLAASLQGRPWLLVVNKIDLGRPVPTGEAICTSARTGEGLDRLRDAVRERLRGGIPGPETRFFASLRQQTLLRGALDALRHAREAAAVGIGMEFASIDLRAALAALGGVTGRNVSDDLLTRIFERFCLGK